MRDHRLDDDDSRVHNHAEVDGTKAHQVAVNAKRFHHPKGEEHAQGDDASHDQSGAPVAQEEYQYENDNQSTFHQVTGNGSLHSVYESGSVDERFYDHSFGERFLYLFDTRLHVLDDFLEVLALEHDGNASHHLALAVAGDGSKASGVTLLHLGDVAHPYGCSAHVLDRDVGNVLYGFHNTNATDIVLVGILLDVTAACVGIVLL